MRTHQPTIRDRPYNPRRALHPDSPAERPTRTPRHRVTVRNTPVGRNLEALLAIGRILEETEARTA